MFLILWTLQVLGLTSESFAFQHSSLLSVQIYTRSGRASVPTSDSLPARNHETMPVNKFSVAKRRIAHSGTVRSSSLDLRASQKSSLDNEEEEDFDLQRIKIGDRDFWTRQKELIDEMTDASEASLKEDMQEKFAKRRLALVGDTAYFGFFIFCLLWMVSSSPFVAISYAFGATMGLAYAYGLGKYVETVGASPDEVVSSQGAGVGGARFAFLILLFVIVGRFRSEGLLEIPAITGFFTYQLASLSQGMKEIND